jgi:hypothetical protein
MVSLILNIITSFKIGHVYANVCGTDEAEMVRTSYILFNLRPPFKPPCLEIFITSHNAVQKIFISENFRSRPKEVRSIWMLIFWPVLSEVGCGHYLSREFSYGNFS